MSHYKAARATRARMRLRARAHICGCLILALLGCDDGQKTQADPRPPDAGTVDLGGVADPAQLAATFDNVHHHILQPGCAIPGCHDPAAASGGLDFTVPASAHSALLGAPPQNPVAAENGWLRVRPADPERSFLIRKLAGPGVGEGMAMPSPAQQLDPAWLDLVSRWIAAGAPPPQGAPTPLANPPPLFTAREARTLTFRDPVRACINCHPTHVREWRISNHAYAAEDPVFHAMVRLGQRQTEGRLGQFCVQCHTPPGLALGQTPVRALGDSHVQDFSGLSAAAQRGVSCDVCHTVTAVNEPRNARMIYTPDGTMRATIADPQDTAAHRSEHSPLHKTSDLCGSCHNVTNPAGAPIEETYDEWASWAQADQKTCQTCHMPAYRGRAAVDGPEREVHRHTFVGVDVSLLPEDSFPGYEELRGLTRALLEQAAEIGIEVRPADHQITVRVRNLAGHRLPSGATAERQLWIEVLVHDAERVLRFESGTVDTQGDLRDDDPHHTVAPGTDPQLTVWRQILFGDAGPVEFPWQAKRVENHLIEPGATDTATYDFGALPPGEYTVQVRLLFRTFPPYFLRALERDAALDPAVKTRVPTVEMARGTVRLTIDGAPPVGGPDCEDDEIVDCNQTCQPRAWLADGDCDDGTYSQWGGADFQCEALAYDQGDCQAPGVDATCPAGEITDCDGLCWPVDWLGDGWCDDGTEQIWGSAHFACAERAWDLADCPDPDAPPPDRPGEGDGLTPEGCLPGFVRDCLDACHPEEWIGDGNCDDGTNADWGHPSFQCAPFGFDRGDCG